MSHRILTRAVLCGTAATVALAAVLAGCTTDDGSGGEGTRPALGSARGGGVAERGPSDAPGLAADGPARLGAAQGTSVGLLSRDVIQRATMTVHARDVGAALARVRTIVAGAQGVVADEQTTTGRRGDPRRSTLTLRVPADAFAAVRGDLADLGRLGSQRVSTQDVSTQVVDVEARILSAERTLQRIRELLQEADDFADVLSLESELARREADLASLKAQQAYLEDQTSLSTISLTLLPPAPAPEEPDDEPAGFVGGLGVGWDALAGLVTVLLTALGVLLPLLLVLAPAGLLAWWMARRLRRPAGAPPAEQPAP